MFDVFLYFLDSGELYGYVTNVTKISFQNGFFRIHVEDTKPQDDFYARCSVFTVHCVRIDETPESPPCHSL